MAKGNYRCNTCGRTFSMAAHLARHSSTHRRGRGRPKGSRNKPGRRRGRPPLARKRPVEIGGDDGNRVLTEMATYRESLLMQKESIDRRLQGLDAALSAMESGPSAFMPVMARRRGRPPGSGRRGRPAGSRSATVGGGGGRGRKPGRPGSLRKMIVQVLRARSKPHSPQEIAHAVVKAGYKTSSPNLTKSVSNTLPQLTEVRKVGRGLYQA